MPTPTPTHVRAALRKRSRNSVRGDVHQSVYANAAACRDCALKAKCTTGASRSITRFDNEAILERMADRLAARPEMLDQRCERAEHPFGSIKQWMGQGAFLMRRLEGVRAEFSLTVLAYNPGSSPGQVLRLAINLVGIPALIAAVRA